MKTKTENLDKIFEIRRENLRRKIREAGGPGSLTLQLNLSNPSYLSHLAGPTPSRVITEKTARKVESLLGLPSGWLDVEEKVHQMIGVEFPNHKVKTVSADDLENLDTQIREAQKATIEKNDTILVLHDKNAGKAPPIPATEAAINPERLAMCLTILSKYKLTTLQQAKIASLMYSCGKPDSELEMLAKTLADLVA